MAKNNSVTTWSFNSNGDVIITTKVTLDNGLENFRISKKDDKVSLREKSMLLHNINKDREALISFAQYAIRKLKKTNLKFQDLYGITKSKVSKVILESSVDRCDDHIDYIRETVIKLTNELDNIKLDIIEKELYDGKMLVNDYITAKERYLRIKEIKNDLINNTEEETWE